MSAERQRPREPGVAPSSFVEALLADARREGARLAVNRPDLRAAVELQETLVAAMIHATGELALGGFSGPDLTPARRTAKLADREPLLLGERIAIPGALRPLLRTLAVALADGGGGNPALHVVEALDARRIDPDAWLAASLGRNRRAIADGGTQMGLAPDLIWLIGEMAAAPLAHLLHQRFWGGTSDPSALPVHALPEGWGPGYCPTCGSWPALAESVGQVRVLRCSFCAGAWLNGGDSCVYCLARGSAYAAETPHPHAPQRRLELCHGCGNYLKAIDVERHAPFPLVSLEDLDTIDLDQVAAERGYTRPPLPDFPGQPGGCRAG